MKKKKQPKGMYVLALTEVFERLSFYTLSFLLVLYASAPTSKEGLGWTKEQALYLTSFYTLAAYTFPVIASFLADRVLGRYKAVVIGGFVIILGHFTMLFSSYTPLFYLALFLVATGTGFFKPCMPALLGLLYSPEDTRRESGFSWYYFGINFGAMIAGVSSGLLLKHYGFHIALASAGVGMILGMLVFFLGKKHLVLDKVSPTKSLKNKSQSSQNTVTKKQKKALIALSLAFVFFACWAIVYNIALSGTLTLYIENYTNKIFMGYDIPSTFFASLESLTILSFTPIFTYFLAHMALKKKYPHFFTQMNFAVFLSAISILYFAYLANIGEHVHEGQKPFQYYEIMLFVIILSISEVLISPVMMAAISLIAPFKFKSLFQSFYLVTFGITSVVAAKIGALSLDYPFKTFFALAIGLFITSIVYFLLKGKMISYAKEAAVEQASLGSK